MATAEEQVHSLAWPDTRRGRSATARTGAFPSATWERGDRGDLGNAQRRLLL